MASAAGSQGPAPRPPGPGCPRAVMHLDMDCFFAAVAEVENPIFKGKPLVSAGPAEGGKRRRKVVAWLHAMP